jgi:PAS domain S-box-containing protein
LIRSDANWFLPAAIDAVSDGVLVESRDRIVYVNDGYARLLGYRSSREIQGKTVCDIAPEDAERLQWLGRCRLEGSPVPDQYTFRAAHRSGTFITLDARVSTTKIGAELFITTVARIISDEEEEVDVSRPQNPGNLSRREQQIFEKLLAGFRAKEIALALAISEKTVSTHRSRMYKKLALRSDLDLFRFASREGLLR